jgi:hypothetical protein
MGSADDGSTKAEVKSTGKSLKDVLSAADMRYTADYKITSPSGTQTMTQVYDLPRFVSIMKLEQGTTRSIFDGETFITCNDMQGSWQCIQMVNQDMGTAQSAETDIKEGNVAPRYIGACSVAGESGSKYEYNAKGVTTTVCYTSDGIMLEMTTSEPKVTMVATKVSRSVDEKLFTPPAKPVDLASMMPK